ncbi:serine/threonine-protein kinase Nek2-like [Lineus longissimus]|uniref:serine/threonine-protein kinase Nek2-like n=1 Tax=Lineus longissimus TaxID=88925 RepID=UPI002B4CB67D
MPSSLEDYEILYSIGSGSYGTCKKIRRKKDGRLLVWKEMDYGTMTEAEKQMLVSEVNLLRELKHKHIVRYYDRIIDRSKSMLYIIMEYCEGGDLSTLINKCRKEGQYLDEDFIWKMMTQITSALKECHRRKGGQAVLHRDLKPANVFLDATRNVKLGDFGLARVLQHETSFAKTFVGTPYYMSPEQMNYMQYNEKSDIWSLGCLIYELCALHPPFTATNQKDLAVRIRLGKFSRIPVQFSEDLNRMIGSMLKIEEDQRPTIEDLLEHPQILKRTSLSTSDKKEDQKKEGEVLKQREEALKTREKLLEKRERELEAKQKSLELRERVVDEKMQRAERMLQEVRQSRLKTRDIMESSPDFKYQILPSCLQKESIPRRDVTPKKKVHFNDFSEKENYNMVNDKYRGEVEKRDGLKERLHKAKIRALELRNMEIESKIKTRQLLGLR